MNPYLPIRSVFAVPYLRPLCGLTLDYCLGWESTIDVYFCQMQPLSFRRLWILNIDRIYLAPEQFPQPIICRNASNTCCEYISNSSSICSFNPVPSTLLFSLDLDPREDVVYIPGHPFRKEKKLSSEFDVEFENLGEGDDDEEEEEKQNKQHQNGNNNKHKNKHNHSNNKENHKKNKNKKNKNKKPHSPSIQQKEKEKEVQHKNKTPHKENNKEKYEEGESNWVPSKQKYQHQKELNDDVWDVSYTDPEEQSKQKSYNQFNQKIEKSSEKTEKELFEMENEQRLEEERNKDEEEEKTFQRPKFNPHSSHMMFDFDDKKKK